MVGVRGSLVGTDIDSKVQEEILLTNSKILPDIGIVPDINVFVDKDTVGRNIPLVGNWTDEGNFLTDNVPAIILVRSLGIHILGGQVRTNGLIGDEATRIREGDMETNAYRVLD